MTIKAIQFKPEHMVNGMKIIGSYKQNDNALAFRVIEENFKAAGIKYSFSMPKSAPFMKIIDLNGWKLKQS